MARLDDLLAQVEDEQLPRGRGSSNTSSSPASLSIGADRTYTGVYYLEVRSSGDVGAYRIEVND